MFVIMIKAACKKLAARQNLGTRLLFEFPNHCLVALTLLLSLYFFEFDLPN